MYFFFTPLFGGKCTDLVATMQYDTFSKKVFSASSTVTPEYLSPPESAFLYINWHAKYYQNPFKNIFYSFLGVEQLY